MAMRVKTSCFYTIFLGLFHVSYADDVFSDVFESSKYVHIENCVQERNFNK